VVLKIECDNSTVQLKVEQAQLDTRFLLGPLIVGGDILQEDFSQLPDEALYRNLDRLHPNRERIERCMRAIACK
jgi:hypothetical protein